MRRLVGMAAVLGLAAGALIGASPAAAVLNWPQHVGDPCTGNGVAAAYTGVVLGNDVTTLPDPDPVTSVPGGIPWVITSWKVNVPADYGQIPEQLVAVHLGEHDMQLLGESAMETVVGGAANEFSTRIPVPEFAVVGLRSPDSVIACVGASSHLSGFVDEPFGLGESRPMTMDEDTGVPVVATLEPDRDNDGYGDETQDQCLEQPLLHTPCPFVRLVPKAKVFRRGILVEVSTGDPTKVEVSGQVGWSYRPRGGGPDQRIVDLSGGAQEVGAGATVPFWLPLPKSVLRRLAKLTRKEKLNVHLAIVATDVVGHQTHRAMGVRLPGWATIPLLPSSDGHGVRAHR